MMAHYRPISLCNVLYQITSKVLSNRMQKVISSVIDEAQSAFPLRRIITNNVIIALEVFHSINSSSSKKDPHISLKLDMSKAFDRVEWSSRYIIVENGFPKFLTQPYYELYYYNLILYSSYGIPTRSFTHFIRYPVRGSTISLPLYLVFAGLLSPSVCS